MEIDNLQQILVYHDFTEVGESAVNHGVKMAELFKKDDLYRLLQKTHQLTFKERFAMYRLCRQKKVSYPSILFLRPALFEKYIREFEEEKKPEVGQLKSIQLKIHKGQYPAPLVIPTRNLSS